MIVVDIKHDFPSVGRKLDAMRTEVAERALAGALTRTAQQAKTAMSREIRSEFTISAAKVNAALRVRGASFKSGVFSMSASLESPAKRFRSLNVINFAARQTARGVTVKIKKTGGRKLLRSAFIGNKGRTVFVREGKDRLPIKAVQTIDVAQMFNTRRINRKVVQFMGEKFGQIFEREARYWTGRFNGSIK